MKTYSPRILLMMVALIFAILVSVLIFIYTPSEINQLTSIIVGFVISFVTSLLMLFFVNIFFIRKINDLLVTVKQYREQSDKPSTTLQYNGNEMDNLNLEIVAWAEDRKEEIERLKKLEVYRKEFLGNVSHELKTPIFNIQGYVLTLLDGGLEDPSINRNYLIRAEKSVDRMITIIEDLEAISQLETGELQLEIERFDLAALMKDVIDAQEMKATEKGIMLTMPEEIKPLYVVGDRFRIRQVIVNLIVNSVKYGKEYGETKIRFYDAGETVLIEIADNGIGIAKKHLPRLFERFYRVDKGRSREQGGTGLGLAIVKHIIEAHNQTIEVMSTEGVGTVFSFMLKKG
ncbi:MAG: ATP-binding protein [Bacteroidia bacterium]|nr:ATP-binding protein [Bacteroidia bacterium]